MKVKSILVLLVLGVFMVACDSDPVEIPANEEITADLKGEEPCCSEENLFERQLHWFSYISAKVLEDDALSRSQVSAYLNITGVESISAAELIGENATVSTAFQAKFHTTLFDVISGNHPDPDPDKVQPTPPPIGNGSMNDPVLIYNLYLDTILDLNCVELYFPNGLTFPNNFTLTSSSHPLTTAGLNEGIKRYSTDQCDNGTFEEEEDCADPYRTEGVVMTQAYVNTNDNIIIARPVRILTRPYCVYNEYAGIDFTDFMD